MRAGGLIAWAGPRGKGERQAGSARALARLAPSPPQCSPEFLRDVVPGPRSSGRGHRRDEGSGAGPSAGARGAGRGVKRRHPRTAMAAAAGARGELQSRKRDRNWRWEEVEGGGVVLLVRGIGP